MLRIRLTDGGMMGVSPVDMSLYMDVFNRHNEITRTVEEIPGGVGGVRNRCKSACGGSGFGG